MESQVCDVLALRKCDEMLHLWEMKMAKLECQFNSRKENSKLRRFKVISEDFINDSRRTKDHLDQHLKILEEEMDSMKRAILWHVKQRKRLINKIHFYFQCMQMLWQRSDEVKGDLFHVKFIMNSPKLIDQLMLKQDGRAIAGLPEVLCPHFNPSLITKGLQATIYFSKKLQTNPTYS
ncbi:uncharacterized protein G2W53_028365 [Senna tora]|uniref:Uncharacterized protein n=1 Tax=Senna tora TaxID=362788 RepID=A0A834T5A4_9FABA|nr:uncharacterized protein G2W53_028365 [Senna tora]